MDRDSNRHTYLFAGIMVVTIAFVLSFTSESLKELKLDNVKKEKMQNILSTVGVLMLLEMNQKPFIINIL